MKNIFLLINNKQTRLLLTLLIICVLLWFGGPYIAIAGHNILASITNRLIAILILVLCWGMNNLRVSHYTNIKSSETVRPPDDIQLLQENLKNTIINARKRLNLRLFSKIPLVIVVGLPQSGKSLLLSQLSGNKTAIVSNKDYDAWIINKILFLELHFDDHKNILWPHFLKLLKTNHWQLSLKSVLATVSLQQLSFKNRQLQQMEVQNLAQQLQRIWTAFFIPTYCVFTQCDLIDGFSDFFENLPAALRQQAFGMIFTHNKDNLSQLFDAKFDHLLKQLNEHLIKRIHEEHAQIRRAKIYEFLLQFEILKISFREIFMQLFHNQPLPTSGCYFISCTQQGTPTNYLQKLLTPTLGNQQKTPNFYGKTWQAKNYFINNLPNQIILQPNSSQPKPNSLVAISVLSILIIFVAGWIWQQSYQQNIATFKALQLAINNAKNEPVNNNLYPYLSTLNALQSALQNIHTNSWLTTASGLAQAKKLTASADNFYQKILIQQFLPSLKTLVENKIQQAESSQDSSDLYDALKVYLMLNNANQRDNAFIKQWFSQYWQQTIPNQQPFLLKHLATLLNNSSLVTTIDEQTVINARDALNQIPLAKLSYSILLDRYNAPLNLFAANSPIASSNTIPILYTAANFNEVFNHQIPIACQEVSNGNWVLGAKSANINPQTIQQLIAAVQNLYLQQYAYHWSQMIKQINIPNFSDAQQMNAALKVIAGKNSPIIQTLQTIQVNTTPNNNEQFNVIVSPQFQQLNSYTVNNLADLQIQLLALKNYFAKINNSFNPDRSAFLAAKERMQNPDLNDVIENLSTQATDMPNPLQSWIKSLAAQSWRVLLNSSQIYLNQVWSNTVLTEYRQNLDQRYPLFKTAPTAVTLSDFTKFFRPDGTIDSFFNDYLKPFVDTTNFYWVWKNVDNQHLNIPQTTLEMFIRASVIQKMYFSHDRNNISIKFALIPVSLEPGVSDFNLTLGTQVIDYQPSKPITTHLEWPGINPETVQFKFINQQGRQSDFTEQGPWALFKLLDKANLQTTPDPKLFKLTFDLNGNSAQYKLLADDIVNPFIPGIVNVFRCPEKL